MYMRVLRVNDSEEGGSKKNTLTVTVEKKKLGSSKLAKASDDGARSLANLISISIVSRCAMLEGRSASLRAALPCVARCAVEQEYIGDEVMIGHVTPLGALSAPNELISLSPMRVYIMNSRILARICNPSA